MKKTLFILAIITLFTYGCKREAKKKGVKNEVVETRTNGLTFNSSNKELVVAFNWAKKKALSYAHDNSDPVGYWYEAALPNREAFCMRDVSHQAIGAELLGLSEHNFNMFLKFSQNISKDLGYCSYWEINRYNLPAPVDYESNDDFWYNLPANFDVVYNAYRLYQWTGNRAYLENKDLKKFYSLSMNQYVDHWQLSHETVLNRNRVLHEVKKENKRFNGKRGIPTYNEGGRGETVLGVDMTASLIAAYKAYAEITKLNGNKSQYHVLLQNAQKEEKFLIDYWYDVDKNSFRSIQYADGSFDYFMVGEDQAFLHYILYFEAISNPSHIKSLVKNYVGNYDKLIVELQSYLPIIFYENGYTSIANKMIIDLCSPENKRRDYPENSFTIVEHITRGLIGVNVTAETNTFTTLSRVENQEEWVEMEQIPILSNKITVKHESNIKSTVTNANGPSITWKAQIAGTHEYLYLNGVKAKAKQLIVNGEIISYCNVNLEVGEQAIVTTTL